MKKIGIILYFIMIISFIILSCSVLRLDILPVKYLIIYFSLVGVFSLIVGLFTFINKNKIIRYIILILMILVSVISFYVSFVILDKADDFLENINEVTENSVFYLIGLNENKYKSIEDLKDKTIGVSNNCTDDVINSLKSKVELKVVKYDNLLDLYNDLLDKKIDGIYIEANIKRLFEEMNEDFSDKVFTVEEVTVKSVIEEKKRKEEEAKLKDTINIYISGIDTYGSIDTVSRSDVNIIMSINQKKKKILLTTIPRDYYVQLHGTTGPKDKLTHAGIYCIDMSVTTLEDLFGINIDYYVRVNFDTLISVIDTIGGIDVYCNYDMYSYGYKFNVGMNHMSGKQALGYCRERFQLPGGDRERGKNHQAVITAIINKVTSSDVLLKNYSEILSNLSYSFNSDIEDELIRDFVKEQLKAKSSWEIRSISVDGYGMHTTSTYSMPGWNLYVMVPYEETIINARNEINSLNG